MIKEAIIPLAGLGTRLLPFSKILPKELLPLGNKTILEHVLDECLEAGIKKIILVTSKRKKIIKDYLYPDPYLLNYLKKKNDNKSIQKLRILDRYRNKIHFFKNYMEGKFRPGHFEGVIEVVKRLLNHVKTNYLFLGKKDYQQLIIIKKYLRSINSKIKVIACDTIRARNGVALSSRNKLLDQNSLKIAGKIINFLKKNKNHIIKSKNNSFFIKKIMSFGAKKVDYLLAFNLKKLKKTNKPSLNTRVFLAYHLSGVRLIDNF
ncbi:MAG: hypothetical protein EBX29_00140 [Candidatus Fonsibacter lacus]|uniref:pantoate--beta-alanine ligase (AMP-forming) n=1 Tax=Candidatus Fonsibacter lacus TaxID=2576439 RepID=A0A966HKZ6_9PROT|nr:hypothetical protein [Candidatus Fonsibacter lacus]